MRPLSPPGCGSGPRRRSPRKAAAPPSDDTHGDAPELDKVLVNHSGVWLVCDRLLELDRVWVTPGEVWMAGDRLCEPDRVEDCPRNNPADSL